MQSQKIRQMTTGAVIAALYCVLTLAVAPIGFGQIQFRVSEVLTILPLFSFAAIPGLAVGCAASNLLGVFMGFNPLGLFDALFGTSATLLAAICTYWIGKSGRKSIRYVFAPFPPVLLNGLIVGFELAILFTTAEESLAALFVLNFATVTIGQAVVCYGLGVPLMFVLYRKNRKGKCLYQEIF